MVIYIEVLKVSQGILEWLPYFLLVVKHEGSCIFHSDILSHSIADNL